MTKECVVCGYDEKDDFSREIDDSGVCERCNPAKEADRDPNGIKAELIEELRQGVRDLRVEIDDCSWTGNYRQETWCHGKVEGLLTALRLLHPEWEQQPWQLMGEPDPDTVVCAHDNDPYGTHELCGRPATENDPNFTYPMCEEHAAQAWACMEIDADMLANAY